MSSILRKRAIADPTRKITFPVPEKLAAEVEALVERAEALGFDVSIEESLEAAYRRIHAKLAKEMKALDGNGATLAPTPEVETVAPVSGCNDEDTEPLAARAVSS